MKTMTTTSLIETGESYPLSFTNKDITSNQVTYQKVLSTIATITIDQSDKFVLYWFAGLPSTTTHVYADANHKTSDVSSDFGSVNYDVSFLVSEKFRDEALAELAELDDYAKEEDLEPPSPIAKKLARELLGKLTLELPREYAVSLWEDGDVVVYSGTTEWRVSVYCRANGGASFYVNSPDKRDYEGHYESASDMPITLITEALKKLSA